MPRPPRLAPIPLSMKGSVYSTVLGRLAACPGEIYPLHVGDTYLEPMNMRPQGATDANQDPSGSR